MPEVCRRSAATQDELTCGPGADAPGWTLSSLRDWRYELRNVYIGVVGIGCRGRDHIERHAAVILVPKTCVTEFHIPLAFSAGGTTAFSLGREPQDRETLPASQPRSGDSE